MNKKADVNWRVIVLVLVIIGFLFSLVFFPMLKESAEKLAGGEDSWIDKIINFFRGEKPTITAEYNEEVIAQWSDFIVVEPQRQFLYMPDPDDIWEDRKNCTMGIIHSESTLYTFYRTVEYITYDYTWIQKQAVGWRVSTAKSELKYDPDKTPSNKEITRKASDIDVIMTDATLAEVLNSEEVYGHFGIGGVYYLKNPEVANVWVVQDPDKLYCNIQTLEGKETIAVDDLVDRIVDYFGQAQYGEIE